jgi:prepilin-type N-terminal cleavage/methylation domain-containing protein
MSSTRAFTLVEVMIAVVLIGIAIAALVASNAAFTQANSFGIDLSTAEFLIEEIRELTTPLAVVEPPDDRSTWGPETGEATVTDYDDLDDFDGTAFSPPIDAAGNPMAEFSSFTQQITVENIDQSNLDTVVADHTSDFVRVTVVVLQNNKTISSTNWIRTYIKKN